MSSICGIDCEKCGFKGKCAGCTETSGCPFGGKCLTAEYIKMGGKTAFEQFKRQLIDEINDLCVEGMPKIEDLNALCGFYVNLEYPLPNGEKVKLLDDKRIYLGTQVPCIFDDFSGKERCFGIVADTGFILICEYGEAGIEPEIVVFKRR